jgi:hypothetical protein
MGGWKEGNLQEDKGINGWVLGGKSSGRQRHKWVDSKREIFKKTKA